MRALGNILGLQAGWLACVLGALPQPDPVDRAVPELAR